MKLPLVLTERLPLVFLAASLACVAYWVLRHLPFPPEKAPPRRALLYPVELLLQRELYQAKLGIPAHLLLNTIGAFGLAGGLLAWPLHNRLLLMMSAVALAAVPYQLVRARARQRSRAIDSAVEPALVMVAKLCEVRNHPYLALGDAAPMLEPPLRAEFERALLETQAGAALPDALRDMAGRCCDNFYLHQLAELVAVHIRDGGNMAVSLQRLVERLRAATELRAEETAELFGYRWLTRILFGACLLPLFYWGVTGSARLQFFVTSPLAQAALVWVVASGLAIVTLPYWLALED